MGVDEVSRERVDKVSRESELKRAVRRRYGHIVREGGSCCPSPTGSSCCGTAGAGGSKAPESIPEGADLGLGCGSPVPLAHLKEGESVLDLGSGAGADCFLAARIVGRRGRVMGVDMTPEMVWRARENAVRGGFDNVEFRLGELEHLPLADGSVDVVMSNCVINLVPDKRRVFEEAFRVLRPGGRLVVSDIVLTGELPARVRRSLEAYTACISGASSKSEYLSTIKGAGFSRVRVLREGSFADPRAGVRAEGLNLPDRELQHLLSTVASVTVGALRPPDR